MTKPIRSMDDLPPARAESYKRGGKTRYQGRYFCPWPECTFRLGRYGYCRGHKDGLSNLLRKGAARTAARERQREELSRYLTTVNLPGDSRTTLGEIAADYFATDGGGSKATPGTLKWYRQLWDTWTGRKTQIAKTPVGEVTQPMASGWLWALRETGHSTSSINSHSTLLRLIVGHAVTKGHRNVNPLIGMKAPTAARGRNEQQVETVAFTQAELWRLADKIRSEYRPVILLCGFVGMRINEALALRESDFGLVETSRLVYVQRQWHQRLGTYTLPKNDKTRIAVVWSFIPSLREEVQKWLGNLPNVTRQATAADLVIVSPRGHRVRYDNFRRDWYKALTAAGLPKVGTHALRRSAATILVNDYGVPITIVADALGHDRATLERYYRKANSAQQIADFDASHVGQIAQVRALEAIVGASAVELGDGSMIEVDDADVIDLPTD